MNMKQEDPWMLQLRQRMADYKKEPPAGLLDSVKREAVRRQAGLQGARRRPGRARRVALRRVAVAAAVLAAVLMVWRGLVHEKSDSVVAQDPLHMSPSASSGSVVASSMTSVRNAVHATGLSEEGGGNELVRLLARRVAQALGGQTSAADSAAMSQPAVLARNDAEKQPAATVAKPRHPHSTDGSPLPAQDDTWDYSSQQGHKPAPRFSVQAAYGGGAGASSGGNGMLLAMADPYGDFSPTMSGDKSGGVVYGAGDTKEERHHSLPVNVGVTVSYRLSDRWALHTGLTYSYLKSEFKRYGAGESHHTDQKLHYVGVPIAVSYDVWQGRRATAYVKAGGQVQKLVSGKADTQHQKDGRQYDSRENIKESRPQFSVAMAAGAAWNVVPQVGVFVEPGLGYYFKNGSHVENIYKEHPLNFELNMGLRINISK